VIHKLPARSLWAFGPLGLALAISAAAPQNPDAFWKKFVDELSGAADPKVLASLVRRDAESAVWTLSTLAQGAANNPTPEYNERIEKLIRAWSDAFKTKFLDNYFEDLRGLDIGQWNERQAALGRYNKAQTADFKLKKGEMTEEERQKHITECVDLAGILEGLSDRYCAAYSWFWAACANDPAYSPKANNPATCLEHYEKAIKLREGLDHRDEFYHSLYAKVEDLRVKVKKGTSGGGSSGGGGAPAGGSGKPSEPKKPANPDSRDIFAAGSKWLTIPAKTLVTPPGEIERPSFMSDDNYLDWLAVGMRGKPEGKPVAAEMPDFLPGKVKFIREADSKFAFDPGDGKLIPMKLGKPYTFEFTLPADGGVTLAWTAAMGSNQEPAHGTTYNASSQQDYAQIYFQPSISRVVDVGGTKVRLFDDSYDGKFGSEPISLTNPHIEGGSLPLVDSMIVGAGTRAVPYSAFLKVGAKWYRLKADSAGWGKNFIARELAPMDTGTLKLEWSGPVAYKPKFMIVRETGEFSGAYFDLAASDKGVEVPVGEYEFLVGTFRNGKSKQMQKYAVIAEKEMKTFKVTKGQVTSVKMGGPFKYVAKVKQDGGEVSIKGRDVDIRGAAGERYVNLSDETPKPKVEWRKPGGKPTELGEMKRGTLEEDPVTKKRATVPDLWFPEDFKAKKPDSSALEFRLSEEHKWFGKIESEWLSK